MPSTSTKRATGAPKGLVVGRLLGAPIVLAWSWFLAAIVITVLFAPWVRHISPGLGASAWAIAFAYVLLLFLSVFLHELAHAIAGKASGQQVAAIELNIWGGFTRFLPRTEDDTKSAATTSFIISIVGPLVNIVLAGLAVWGLSVAQVGSVSWLLLLALAVANGALGVINLLPGIPLDGGWALQALIWRATASQYRGTIIASWVGRIIALAFVFCAIVVPLLSGTRPDLITVAWTTAIAVMLWFSAGDAATHAKRARRMETYDLDRVIQPAIAAAWDAQLDRTLQVADAQPAGTSTLVVILDARGLPDGLLDRRAASHALAERPGPYQVHQFMHPLGAWIGVPHDITAPHLLESLTHRPKAQFCLVMENSTLTGVIDLQEFYDELLAD